MAHRARESMQHPLRSIPEEVIGGADGPRRADGLSFCLPPSVTLRQEPDSLALVLDYPLRFLRLNELWRPVFTRLAAGGYVAHSDLTPLIPRLDPLRVEFFLSGLVRKGFLKQQGLPPQDACPSVSIIIPVRNRPVEIRACLESLAKLNYPPEKLEILVVDDCSTDATPEVIREFPVTLLGMEQHRQASFCRNAAARHARHDILAFIDSDCEAHPDWLPALTPAFREDSVAAVGGMIDSCYSTNHLDRYEKVQSSLMVSTCSKRSGETDRFFYVPSCNFLIRRERFLQLGGFRNHLHVGEDVDLCWRLQDSGFQVEYRPVGTIYHKHRNRLLPFCSRRFDYGTSEPQLHKSHENRRKRMLFPPLITLFWLAVAGFAWTGHTLFLPPVVAAPLYSFLSIERKIRGWNGPVSTFEIMLAVPRSYGAWLYHLCAFVSRYYLLLAPVLLPVAPTVSSAIVMMHGVTCLGQFIIKKPRLNFPFYFFYFSLEQISYQAGVWWGSLANGYFGSIFPKAAFVRTKD